MICLFCWNDLTGQEHQEVRDIQNTDTLWHLWLLKMFKVASHVVEYVNSCMDLPVCMSCWLAMDWEKRQKELEKPLLYQMEHEWGDSNG